MKTLRYIAIALVILLIWGGVAFYFGARSVRVSESTTTYEPLPVVNVSKSETELAPTVEQKDEKIVFVEVYNEGLLDSLASLRATIEDWNARREYCDTLLNSDTLGLATISEVVQYNKLVSRDFSYEPRQKSVVTIVPPKNRLQPYAMANATIRAAELGAGVKYGKFGAHLIAGYDYKADKMVLGAGVMVVF